MSREIKFRGWHEEDKIMVYDLNSLRLIHGVLFPIVIEEFSQNIQKSSEIYTKTLNFWRK